MGAGWRCRDGKQGPKALPGLQSGSQFDHQGPRPLVLKAFLGLPPPQLLWYSCHGRGWLLVSGQLNDRVRHLHPSLTRPRNVWALAVPCPVAIDDHATLLLHPPSRRLSPSVSSCPSQGHLPGHHCSQVRGEWGEAFYWPKDQTQQGGHRSGPEALQMPRSEQGRERPGGIESRVQGRQGPGPRTT